MASDPLVIVALLAVVAIGVLLVRELRQRRREELLVQLLAAFAPAISQGKTDPQGLVAWSEVADCARRLFPEAYSQLDAASGGRFPFSRELVQAAHARWTAEWLGWERQHDLEYKQRVSAAETALDRAGDAGTSALRAELAAINQEKLQKYQDRYEDYVRVGKAIAALED